MNYEVLLVPVPTGKAPTAPTPLPPYWIAQKIEAMIASRMPPIPLPTGPILARRAAYESVLRGAFSWCQVSSEIPGSYSLAAVPKPCRVNPDGGWDPIDGASIELLHLTVPGVTDTNKSVEHYLSIGPKTTASTGTSSCTWTLTNTTGQAVEGLTVFLAHSRSRLVYADAYVDTRKVRLAPDLLFGEGSMLAAKFESPLASNGLVKVKWTFRGDPPHVRALTWWTGGGRVVPHLSGDPGLPPITVPINQIENLYEYARTQDEEFQLRELHIATIQDRTRPYRAFFFDLDHRTQPEPGTVSRVGLLTGYLRSRYLVRAEEAGFGNTLTPDPIELNYWGAIAIQYADLFESIVREHFTDQASALDVEELGTAFELFAGGQLTDFDTHGAPNGVNFFAFCEFAMLCVELRHQAKFWGMLIPIFARASEIFARCYHECCGPRTSCGYRVAHNPLGARGFTDGERTALRQAWQGIDSQVGFARIVHAALEDELYPGTVIPFGLTDKCVGESPVCPPRRHRERDSRLRSMPSAGR